MLACGYWESSCVSVGDRYLVASFKQTGTGSDSALFYELTTKSYVEEDCSGEAMFEESYRWESLNETTNPSYPCNIRCTL